MHYLEIPILRDGETSSRTSLSCESIYSDSLSRSDGEDVVIESSKKKRVRANLSNMTMEDKIKRRKMKNRVAAQAARDRKKCKMDTMEVTLSKFSEEKLKLQKENERLRKENEKFKLENARLLERLSGHETGTTTALPSNLEETKANPKTTLSPVESAALINDSLPQNQGPSDVSGKDPLATPVKKKDRRSQSPVSMMQFACLLMSIANQTKSSTGLPSAPLNSSTTLSPPKVLPKTCSPESSSISLLLPPRKRTWNKSGT